MAREIAGIDHCPHTVCREHFHRADERWLGERVGVAPDVQGAVDATSRAVVADRLGDGQDVRLVEPAAQRRAAVPARAEAHALRAIGELGLARVVLASKRADIDEKVGGSGPARQRMDRHETSAACAPPPARSSPNASTTTERGCAT
jgi:hypothetical protein